MKKISIVQKEQSAFTGKQGPGTTWVLTTVLLIFSLFPVFCKAQLFSNPVKKYYALLNSGNYDEFSQKIKKYSQKHKPDVAVYYAWARFYFEDENKKHNIDSAKYYMNLSVKATTDTVKGRRRKIYVSLGVRPGRIKNLAKQINTTAFLRATGINSVEGWNFFLNNYADAAEYAEAKARRNKLAFEQAKDKYDLSSFEQFIKQYPNASEAAEARSLYEELLYRTKTADSTSVSYLNFTRQYPNSPYYAEARSNYERILYREKTHDHQLLSYITFTAEYPNSPYLAIAQDSIYYISTRVATRKNYEAFIKKYSPNPHTGEAWIKFFQLSLVPYTDSTMKNFKSDNPSFPYPGLIDKEESSLLLDLRIEEDNGLYGYKDSMANKTVIPMQFNDANDFSEGLAAVSRKVNGVELYGFINKYGEVKIPFICRYVEDFINGYAIVANGTCENDSCLYGAINRIGYPVLPMIYDEVFPFSEKRCLLRKDSLYGFVDNNFNLVIPFKYSDAFSFSNGFAAVGNDSGWKFIDKNGYALTSRYYVKLLPFSEGLAAAEDEDELWGYIDASGAWVIMPQYVQAEPFKDGRAKVFVPATKKKNSVKLPKEKYIDKTGKFVE